MANSEFTIDDLRRILRAAAGEDEGLDLDGDILDAMFADLGYDSLALLETAGWIERERGIRLHDATITDARTPRALLTAVNQQVRTTQPI